MSEKKKAEAADREIVETFYAMCHMAGLNKVQTTGYAEPTFFVGGMAYNVKAHLTDKDICAFLGGRNRALKLLTYCEMVTILCSKHRTEHPHAFGLISGSMLRLVERYPCLRSYYDKAEYGGSFKTWYGWKYATTT